MGLFLEGRYDNITGHVVKDIMSVIKKTVNHPVDEMVHIQLPHNLNGHDYYTTTKTNITFSVEVNIIRSEGVKKFKVESFKIVDEDTLEFNIIINPKLESKIYSDIFVKLQEDFRHEFEHLLQDNYIGDRPEREDFSYGETTYEHHSKPEEIPAMVQGFYRRAKTTKRNLDDVMIEDLDDEIEQGNLTKDEAEKLLDLWLKYSKRRLPKALYRNG